MAAEIQTGVGVLFGITNDGTQIAMPGYATFKLQDVKAAHKFELDTVKDELKFDASLIAANENIEVDITWVPTGATRAAAAATAVFLTPLSSVALLHFKVGLFNATWVYIGDGTLELAQAPAKMNLKLRKYADSTQNTSLTTTVVG